MTEGIELVHIRVIGWPVTYNGTQFPSGTITAIPVRQAKRLVERGAAAYVDATDLHPGESDGEGEPAPNATELSSETDAEEDTPKTPTRRKKATEEEAS